MAKKMTRIDKIVSEEQIERMVEVRTNAADNALMNRRMTQQDYDFHMKALNRWADMCFAKIAREQDRSSNLLTTAQLPACASV